MICSNRPFCSEDTEKELIALVSFTKAMKEWRSVRGGDPSTTLEVWFTKEIHLTAVNARAAGSGQLNLIA